MEERAREKSLPRLNLRPFLVLAVGLICGIYLSYRASVGVRPADALVFALFLLLLAPPFAWRRVLAVVALFTVAAGLGAGLFSFACSNFTSGAREGEYTVTGTAQTVSVYNGYCVATLSGLSFDGASQGGNMRATLPSENVRPGDVVTFSANVSRNLLPSAGGRASDLASDLRYTASPAACEVTGKSGNLFLRANAALYDVLFAEMDRDCAGIAYALLTGNSAGIDGGLLDETRTGGIAHVFAVSGLHIGILYGAVMLCLRPLLRRWSFIPALCLAAGYCALCAFTVSSVRALIMCAVAGVMRFRGAKYDLLSSLSFAAVLTLLLSPAKLLSVSFQLSYGAVAGLALFSGSFSRGLKKLHIGRIFFPARLADALASSAAVQIFTFPLMMEAFGYFSVWGTLLNLVVIPALPVLFLPLIVCGFLSALFPAAAPVLLALPEGLLSAFLFCFSSADFSAVLAGFALGAGGIVWFAGMVTLSGRVRLSALARGLLTAALAASFALVVCAENIVFSGCRIDVTGYSGGDCALVREGGSAVLLVDGDVSLATCEDFLDRTYGGQLDAVIVLSSDGASAVNVAAFLPAEVIYTYEEVETGLRETHIVRADRIELGGMRFVYEGADRLALTAEGVAVEFAFEGDPVLFADLSVQTCETRLKYLLKDGIIRVL